MREAAPHAVRRLVMAGLTAVTPRAVPAPAGAGACPAGRVAC